MCEIGLGWTQEIVIRLVEEYKKKRELWDSSDDNYGVQTAKYEAWCELADTFECDIEEVRRKFNSILSSLRREKLKVRCGDGSTWFLYDRLSFLPRHIPNNLSKKTSPKLAKKRNKGEIEESEQSSNDTDNDTALPQDDEEDEDVEDEQKLIYIKQEPVAKTNVKTTPKFKHPTRKHRLTRSVLRKIVQENPRSRFDSKILETLRLIRQSDSVKKRDDCDSFGDYIAVSLRKHDDKTQCMIKQAINNILFEQELKNYGPGTYEVLIDTDDDNLLVLDT